MTALQTFPLSRAAVFGLTTTQASMSVSSWRENIKEKAGLRLPARALFTNITAEGKSSPSLTI